MIRSMTGYARVVRQAGDRELVVSVKSLNHRGLDIHFHLVSELEPLEPAFRAAVKRAVARGHVDVRISVARAGNEPPMALNRALLESYISAHQEAAEAYGLASSPDLNSALRVPGMFEQAASVNVTPEIESALLEALEAAVSEMNAFREREGEELRQMLAGRNRAVLGGVAKLEELRDRAIPMFEERLKKRLDVLLGGLLIEPQRLAQEVALLVDRSDIGEELERLKIHAGQLDQMLEAGGEVGKKLDFLLQEMNRETNTILSKTGSAGEAGLEITGVALAIRSDLEKIREQLLNLE
jgi:uncharacterized protein (TIGR00255 family)